MTARSFDADLYDEHCRRVTCPVATCAARPGQPCTNPHGDGPPVSHWQRNRAADQLEDQ